MVAYHNPMMWSHPLGAPHLEPNIIKIVSNQLVNILFLLVG